MVSFDSVWLVVADASLVASGQPFSLPELIQCWLKW